MKSFLLTAAAAVLATPALAQRDTPPPAAEAPPEAPGNAPAADAQGVHQDDAGRLVAFARRIRAEKGCLAAAPAFRVAAAMGDGNEAAQHELGECLLDTPGASAVETALFRQEGVFWLTRAAYAGNARAQRRLVLDMAAPANALHDPKAALQWALVYEKNPTADLYGFKELPKTLVPGLRASLSPEAVNEAEAFASGFTTLPLAKFEAPTAEKPKRPQGPPPGARPRRPGVIGGA
jgi:TPR repeat protein